jgi:hypothetical protein
MEQHTKEVITQFGWDWRVGLPQILLLLSIVLAAYGTWRAWQHFDGWALVAWVLVCWLLPIIGTLIVVSISRRRRRMYDHKAA